MKAEIFNAKAIKFYGLSIEQYEGSLEYFVNISNKGYGTEVDFKTFNVLLAVLKAVANAKE